MSVKHINAWWPKNPSPGNFGDILTPILLKELFNLQVVYKIKPFKNTTLLGIGSIISKANKNCVVWGSGLISNDEKININARYLSVRGPRTYEKLKDNNILCEPIFGDPALLMPRIYAPDINKKYEYGFFPHYVDHNEIKNWYRRETINNETFVINPLNSKPKQVINQLLQCKKIISSSLHGIIIAHAYGIPAVWVKHSNKLSGDDIKFYDYFESVKLSHEYIDFYEKININDFNKFNFKNNIDINTDKIINVLENYLNE